MSFNFLRHNASILYRDRAILVINKPAGMVSQGTKNMVLRSATVDGWIDDYCRKSGEARLKTVHRLDRETTGAFVLAKPSHVKDISNQFRNPNRQIEKIYLAVVLGRPSQDKQTVETFLIENDGRVSLGTSQDGARLATSTFEVLAESSKVPGMSLVRMRLGTGMKHQLRIQSARVLGTPIIGDDLYGDRRAGPQCAEPGRMFLHSAHITLERFLQMGKRLRLGISAGVPPHFAQLCDLSGLPLTNVDRCGGIFIEGQQHQLKSGEIIPDLDGEWLPDM